MRKTYKFRIRPTTSQRHRLGYTLRWCRELDNGTLEERRSAYTMRGIIRNYYDQANQLASIEEVRPDLEEIHLKYCKMYSSGLIWHMWACMPRNIASVSVILRIGLDSFRNQAVDATPLGVGSSSHLKQNKRSRRSVTAPK